LGNLTESQIPFVLYTYVDVWVWILERLKETTGDYPRLHHSHTDHHESSGEFDTLLPLVSTAGFDPVVLGLGIIVEPVLCGPFFYCDVLSKSSSPSGK
jgi:hypothetical protein